MTKLETILTKIENVRVINSSIDYKYYAPLDLSISNKNLINSNLKTSSDFENYIENFLNETNAKVAYGGYKEHRNLYQRSTIFNDSNKDERNIHIGLDLWINAPTNVLAALDGSVHSFKFNEGLGNYGPTIILEHTIEEVVFYTLYGHLSKDSIKDIIIGQQFKKGEIIAQLGSSSVNGDYAPHLHFQIIKNLDGNHGDYPGVCAEKDLQYYLENCPNPNILLKIV